ncbi:DUF4295 family protein [Gracilimonas mengyeensis]|uniref:DUF4295 domain-containing protein n=1 Tax=Gracilimonas mengyeensis TaxID=1302730 RepID=A0A521CT98_9BACT|nr:DUF4295 family protein [Gracilimonas mengyeensis]SMO61951.1 protein of unknown function [Gracilimonas mengyeensis]
MAKQQAFGQEALQAKAAHRKMAKVIVATKNNKGKYAYKEVMVEQDNVQEYIQQNKS